MRRAGLALLPILASCGLLMDFEPGADDGAGGAPGSSQASGSTGPGMSSSASSSAGSVSSAGGAPATSTGSSGGGEGGQGGAFQPWNVVLASDGEDRMRALAVSPGGSVAIAGEIGGDIELEDPHGNLWVPPATVGTFVAVYAPDGGLRYARVITRFDASLLPYERDTIDIDFVDDDRLVVSGSFAQTADVHPEGLAAFQALEGEPEAFVAMLDVSEPFSPDNSVDSVLWATRSGDGKAHEAKVLGGALALAADGTAFVTGWHCGNAPIFEDVAPSPACDGPDGPSNIWLTTFHTDGTHGAIHTYGYSDTRDVALDIDVDAGGTMIGLTGEINGALILGGGGVTVEPVEGITTETFVAVLTHDGVGTEARALGQRGAGVTVLCAADGCTDVRFAGSLDPDGFGKAVGSGDRDFVAGRLASTAVGLAIDTHFDGPEPDAGFLRRDDAGEFFAYGGFRGTCQFGPGMPVQSAGGIDAFAVALDGQGDAQTVRTFSGLGDQLIVGAERFGRDVEVVGGHLTGTTVIGDQTVSSVTKNFDIFVVAHATR